MIKKTAWFVWSVMVVQGLANFGGQGWAAPTENHVLWSTPAPGPVHLDRDLSDWDRSGAIVLADDVQKPHHIVRVTSMYDPTSFYLAFEFKDPTPMVNHMDPNDDPSMGWCGDAVQLRFNTAPGAPDQPENPGQLLHLDGYWYSDGKKAEVYAVYGDLSSGGKVVKIIRQALGQGVEMSFHRDPDGQGYLQIIRIDWKFLRPDGPAFQPGQSFRMAIEVLWGLPQYGRQPGDRVTDLLNPKRPERELLWTNPPAFGTVELMAHGGLAPSETAAMWPTLLAKYEQDLKEVVPTTLAPVNVQNAPNQPCLESKDETQRLLNQWFADGTAAGNTGDYYDNRDRGHSAVDLKGYPQLKPFAYTPAELAADEDFGLFLGVRPLVTFGNSSTSSFPEGGGCNPRHAMMMPGGMTKLYAQYRGANFYVYPAHWDYHPGHNGQGFYGDLLPFNSPYVLTSLGSSGSDIAFLNAFIHTTAAFSPKVKGLLLKHGMLMPTLQAIMRASDVQVTTPEDYFTGKAHPAVFRGDQLDELKMVQAAHGLTPEQIPPLALIRVVKEDELKPGVNAPDGAPSEDFFDTPAAVGRVFRRWDRTLSMTVSAADTFDWMGRPLQFRWVLLQGNPKQVQIEPSADGHEAKLTIAWHDRFPIAGDEKMETNRVDIGVFACAGQGWSAPAFISICCPDNELRTYDDAGRLVDIFYAAGDPHIGYDTPVLLPVEDTKPYPIRDWPALLDRFNVDEAGALQDLFHAGLNDAGRAVVAATSQQLKAQFAQSTAQMAANPPTGLYARRTADRDHAVAEGQLLLAPVPALGSSIKDLIEGVLNGWIDDPMFYLHNRAALDAEAARLGPDVRKALEQARQRLIDLGIYQPTTDGGWELHCVRAGDAPVVGRLTRYERLELQRFHLTILTQVVLPGVVVRDYSPNYVDFRMAKSAPLWMVFSYDKDGMISAVHTRKTDVEKSPLPLEKP